MKLIKYGTIKRGKIKFKIGSKQDKFLHFKKLPHSHVIIENGEKSIKRYNVDVKASKRARGYVRKL